MAEKIDIVEYIGQTEELHRKGLYYFINCPFHSGDDTPSLCIYPNTNKWYCFGCKAGSSIYDWIMKKEGLKFPDAVRKVAELSDTDMDEYEESESMAFLKNLEKHSHKVIGKELNREVLDFQKDYIEKYSDECPDEWLHEDMTEEALKTYNIRIDHNANRIVYPVFDADGNFIGVKGRTRLESYKELGLAKYINYQKIGRLDYFQGWQQALPEIINRKSVVIFEGIKSCIKAWGWNIRNTVASETSKLADGQLELLVSTGISEVIFAWDSDQDFKSIIQDDKIKLLKKFTQVSVVRDTKGLLQDKESPVDRGEEVFRMLLESRVKL